MSSATNSISEATSLSFVISEKDATRTLIEGQHGSLGKGLCELVMNAIDSGARICRIVLEENRFSVADDGAGFGSDPKKSLKKFQALGSRNSEREGATFGRFGLGRAQVIPWGKIRWESDRNRFETDYQDHPGFTHSRLDQPVEGCKVSGELYKALSRFELRDVRNELIENLEFAEGITIELNGSAINDNTHLEWDEVTDLYKIRWIHKGPSRGLSDLGCRIYNQGVLVNSIHSHYYPMGATVVARKAIKVNIARNAPDPQCPVSTAIMERLDEKAREIRRDDQHSKQMNLSLRQALVSLLDAGVEDFPEVIEEQTSLSITDLGRAKLLRDCRGNFVHFDQLETKPLTIVPDNQIRIGESLSMLNVAVPVTHEEMRYWGAFNAEQLMARLKDVMHLCRQIAYGGRPFHSSEFLPPLPFEKAATLADTSKRIVPNKELSVFESAARNALQYASDIMAKRISKLEQVKTVRRRIVIGECLTAAGWTDSASFIAIERRQLPLGKQGISGACALTMLLLHEYTHNNDFPDCDAHGEAFYERYHDLTGATGKHEIIGNVSTSLRNRFVTELLKKNQVLPDGLKSIATEAEQEHFVLDCGRDGLSDFARTVLEKSQLIVRYGRSKVEVVENREAAEKVCKKLSRYLNLELASQLGTESVEDRLKAEGLANPSSFYPDRFGEFNQRRSQVISNYANACADLANDKLGWSAQALYQLIVDIHTAKTSRFSSGLGIAGRLIQSITIDEQSECSSFEATTRPLLTSYIVGSSRFAATLDTWEYRGIGQHYGDFDGDSLKQSATARREWLKNRVEQLLESFGDASERSQAKSYLRDHVLAQGEET